MSQASITSLIHHSYVPPAGFDAPQPGVFKASTVIFPNVAAMRGRDWKNKSGYTYGLHGTPTTFLLKRDWLRWRVGCSAYWFQVDSLQLPMSALLCSSQAIRS